MMKALHTIEFPKLNDLTAIQKSFNSANQRFLNTNFRMIADELYEHGLFIDSIADYVTEQGLNGVWFYRIWASGTVEAWCETASDTAIITTAEGSLYKAEKEIALPALFTDIDSVTVSVVSTTPLMTNVKSYDTTAITMHVISAVSDTATLTFFAYVIGR